MAQQATQPPSEADLRALELASPGEMTLIDHLRELRTRVFICAVTVAVMVMVSFVFRDRVFDFLLEPGRNAVKDGQEFRLNSFSPTDRVFVVFKICGYAGLILASPIVIYQILAFVIPGLTPRERRAIFPSVFGFLAFLLAGMAFSYYVILPASLGFLFGFEDKVFENEIGAQQYIGFVTRMIFWVGLCFEMPMVMMFLAKLRVARAGQMLRFWRYAIVIIAVIAAVATPTPDAVTMSLVIVPLLGLYVLGIGMAWVAQPKRPAESPG